MEYFDILNEFGEFTGKVMDRDTCHKEGFWHRAIYGFIINNDGDVLLQRRSKTKKLWPDLWDITAGGHVLTGEFGEQALIREVKEETGITNVKPIMNDIFSLEIIGINGHKKRGKYVSSHVHLNCSFLLEADDQNIIFDIIIVE